MTLVLAIQPSRLGLTCSAGGIGRLASTCARLPENRGKSRLMRQELMAGMSHAAQIDLCLGGVARKFLDFGVGACPGNFARERFHLFAQGWIGTNRQAQPVAKRVSRRASAAPDSSRAGAGARIRAVGLDLPIARQDAFFRCAGVVSISSPLCPRSAARSVAVLHPGLPDAARSRSDFRRQ